MTRSTLPQRPILDPRATMAELNADVDRESDTYRTDIWICDTCPFTTSDPDGIAGHKAGPSTGRGWFGVREAHRMSAARAAIGRNR